MAGTGVLPFIRGIDLTMKEYKHARYDRATSQAALCLAIGKATADYMRDIGMLKHQSRKREGIRVFPVSWSRTNRATFYVPDRYARFVDGNDKDLTVILLECSAGTAKLFI